ncbi:MAG: M1 family metallopeptidase [Gemmatimonadetes bacterium]|nr:M1 family metallopeptidase [Gemmatimonadota bacterium]
MRLPARTSLALAALVASAPAVIGSFAALPLSAQASPRLAARPAPRAVADTSIFAPLSLPAPNEYRGASGAPGPRYWQNRADYVLRATLDTAAQTVEGALTLRYTNRSPDTLRFVWLHTEQNAFRSGSLNTLVFEEDGRFGGGGFRGGYTIATVQQVVGTPGAPRRVDLARRDQETLMAVDLAEPLAPGRTATLELAWRFRVPEHGADRMGRDGALYEIAQWYPRVAVYDDVRGWNIEPYLGQGEFYLDYGDIDLAVTVPAGYIVAATGALQNAAEVLTVVQRARLAAAARSDTVVRVITAEELERGTARPRQAGMLTWRFRAKNVRDAVWAASPDYQWDATSWKGIMAYAYYRPSAAAHWHDAADQSRMSIMEYSERWFPYPWPHISAVEGPISGMEYPMIAMENRSADVYDLFNVVTHEIGHMWFPMIVGSNERQYMWQDEGFNTFINTFAEGRRYPERGDQMARAAEERRLVEQVMMASMDGPVDIPPDRIAPDMLGVTAYVKPSVGLQLLRQEVLGEAAFDAAFKAYTARWAYRHPTPADFYRTMENVAGRRLDWFWRGWFVENARFDQAVDSVAVETRGDTAAVTIAFGNRERGVLPIRARLTFSDGTTQELRYPAEVWSTNSRRYERQFRFVGKRLMSVELDPDHRLVDVDRRNNVWGQRPPRS